MDNSITLEALGITKDELINRMVDRFVRAMGDDDGFSTQFEEHLADHIESTVANIAKSHADKIIEAKVGEVLEAPWKRTNSYGEQTKEPMTFKEMAMARIDEHLQELIGERTGKKDSYGEMKISRMTYLIRGAVDSVIKATVEKAAKEAAEKARQEVLNKMDSAVIAAVRNVLGIR